MITDSWKGVMMNNLVCLALYGFITVGAVLIAVFTLCIFELVRQMILDNKRYLHFKHLRTHEDVRNLKRYHVGGFINEHKR